MTDDKSREAFEMWLETEQRFSRAGISNLRNANGYEMGEMQISWEGWQAALRYRDEQEKQA